MGLSISSTETTNSNSNSNNNNNNNNGGNINNVDKSVERNKNKNNNNNNTANSNNTNSTNKKVKPEMKKLDIDNIVDSVVDDNAVIDTDRAVNEKAVVEELITGDINMKNHIMQLKSLKKHFDRYDTDNSGYISLEEMNQLISAIYEPTLEEVRNFVSQFDANSDGSLTWNEFKRTLCRINPEYKDPANEEKVRALFTKYDVDGNEFIEGDEILLASQELLQLNPLVVKRLIELFDKDGDGQISFKEFSETLEDLQEDYLVMWEIHREARLRSMRPPKPRLKLFA